MTLWERIKRMFGGRVPRTVYNVTQQLSDMVAVFGKYRVPCRDLGAIHYNEDMNVYFCEDRIGHICVIDGLERDVLTV